MKKRERGKNEKVRVNEQEIEGTRKRDRKSKRKIEKENPKINQSYNM